MFYTPPRPSLCDLATSLPRAISVKVNVLAIDDVLTIDGALKVNVLTIDGALKVDVLAIDDVLTIDGVLKVNVLTIDGALKVNVLTIDGALKVNVLAIDDVLTIDGALKVQCIDHRQSTNSQYMASAKMSKFPSTDFWKMFPPEVPVSCRGIHLPLQDAGFELC